MNGSHADTFRRGALTGLVAALACWTSLASAPASAQGGPQPLVPSGRASDPAPPPAAPPASEPVPGVPEGTGSLLPVDVNAAPLAPIDPDSVGTLTADEGGFGFDMWAGTRRGVVEAMLPAMPARTISPTLRSLMRRLLLSNARAPAGNGKSKSLMVLRVQQLAAMGDVAAVESLLNVAPTRGTDPALVRIEADMLFLESDNARVCPLVASQSGTSDEPYWRKADIFCQALAGEHNRAALGANLLRDQGDQDRLFFDLLDTLLGFAKPKIESMANAQPLHFAMARAAKVSLPADVAATDHPAILRTVATLPGLSNELRLDAAERAEAMGVIDVKVLRDIYASISFPKDQLDNALSAAQSDQGPVTRALLYRRAVQERVPAALAQIIHQALSLVHGTPRYQTQARVYRPMISDLAPTRDLLWLAPDAARALLITGDTAGVNNWFDILRASAVLDEQSAQLRDRLMVLARLAGAINDQDWNPDAIGAWFDAVAAGEADVPADPEDVRAQATLAFNLLEALGDTVPETQWERTVAGGAGSSVVPNAAVWRQLNAAALAGRKAETVMLAAVALGPGQLGAVDPTVLRFVVESVRGVGLPEDARAVAVEAAVSAGI